MQIKCIVQLILFQWPPLIWVSATLFMVFRGRSPQETSHKSCYHSSKSVLLIISILDFMR